MGGVSLRPGRSGPDKLNKPCRIYAPSRQSRGIFWPICAAPLENGANTSFVNRIAHAELPVDRLVKTLYGALPAWIFTPHPRIPSPSRLYGDERRNSKGLDLADPYTTGRTWRTKMGDDGKIIAGMSREQIRKKSQPIYDPAHSDSGCRQGCVLVGKPMSHPVAKAVALNRHGTTKVLVHALILDRVADLLKKTWSS